MVTLRLSLYLLPVISKCKMIVKVHQVPEPLRTVTLKGDTEWMLPATEDTLEDDSEGRAHLHGQTAVVTATEMLLVPFMPGILLHVFVMTVEEGNWVKFTKCVV